MPKYKKFQCACPVTHVYSIYRNLNLHDKCVARYARQWIDHSLHMHVISRNVSVYIARMVEGQNNDDTYMHNFQFVLLVTVQHQ